MATTVPTLPLPDGVTLSFGSEVTRSPKVNEAQFGDGYSQRSGDGLNNVQSSYSVLFTNLTWEETMILDDFFTLLGGWRQFTFQNAFERLPRLWICKEWKLNPGSAGAVTLSCTWKEVFN